MEIRLYTEDSSTYAFDTLEALVIVAVKTIKPDANVPAIKFNPQAPELRHITTANNWRSDNPRHYREIVALRRSIATELVVSGTAFVLFHYDADVTWGRRSDCLNRKQFELKIREKIRLLLLDKRYSASETSEALSRLIEVVPHYSIEAWCYQNIEGLRESCTHGKAHMDVFDAWESAPASLDEIPRLKSQCCVGSTRNATLAKGVNRERLNAANKSFARFVDRLREDEQFANALPQYSF